MGDEGHEISVAKIGGQNYIDADFFVNLGPHFKEKNSFIPTEINSSGKDVKN